MPEVGDLILGFCFEALLASRPVRHFVMPRDFIEGGQHGPRRRLDDGGLGFRAGERFDGLERVPEGDGEELDMPFGLAAQQIGAAVSGDLLQMRRDLSREMTVIGLGGIGGVAAGCLRDADRHDIIACARRPLDRLTLERPEGTVEVALRTLTDPGEAAPVDWVLLCTKAHETASAGPWLRRLCGPS